MKPEPELLDPQQLLRSVEVRLIERAERVAWDQLMRDHHYLGFRSMVGESLRYVALHSGHWVALLGWCAAALNCKARDRWIGWDSALQWSRLPLLANNSRFLILPPLHTPNLASRILALNLKRLSQDWECAFGHPILLAETFVDPRYFQGTCYKAAGWIFAGHSLGFARHHKHYVANDSPKMVFLRPIQPRARQLLCSPYLETKLKVEPKPMSLSVQRSHELIERLANLRDPRMRRGIRHKQISVLAIAICAILSGARSFAAIAEWGKRCSANMLKRIGCRYDRNSKKYHVPSEPTIRRLLQSADAEEVDTILCGWLQSLSSDDAVAVDGKTLRGARQDNGQKVHLLSAFLHHQGTVIAQCLVDGKTNEIPMVRTLLDPVQLKGRVVTADAMHTQVDTARYLVEEKGAHYLFTVKDNQPTLKSDIEALDLCAFPPSRPNHR